MFCSLQYVDSSYRPLLTPLENSKTPNSNLSGLLEAKGYKNLSPSRVAVREKSLKQNLEEENTSTESQENFCIPTYMSKYFG